MLWVTLDVLICLLSLVSGAHRFDHSSLGLHKSFRSEISVGWFSTEISVSPRGLSVGFGQRVNGVCG